MDLDRVDQVIDGHDAEPSSLIQVLLEIQAENHWLPGEALDRVRERLGVPLARIHAACPRQGERADRDPARRDGRRAELQPGDRQLPRLLCPGPRDGGRREDARPALLGRDGRGALEL